MGASNFLFFPTLLICEATPLSEGWNFTLEGSLCDL
jgi:hypothetical protein